MAKISNTGYQILFENCDKCNFNNEVEDVWVSSNKVLFLVNSAGNRELWQGDGLAPPTYVGNYLGRTVSLFKDKFYLVDDSGTYAIEGNVKVKLSDFKFMDFSPGDNVAYYTVDNNGERKLWWTDGITFSPVVDTDLNNRNSGGAGVVVGDVYYYVSDDEKHGRELWRATQNGTAIVSDINTVTDAF